MSLSYPSRLQRFIEKYLFCSLYLMALAQRMTKVKSYLWKSNGLYINGRFYIIDKFDNVAWPAESDPEDSGNGTS